MFELYLDSLDGVEDAHKTFYEEKDGKFQLKVSGLEDTSAIKRESEQEKQARLAAEQAAKETKDQLSALQQQINDAKDQESRAKGDTDALDKSWQEKYSKLESEKQSEIDSLNSEINNILVTKQAVLLGAEISVNGDPEVLLPHIERRLGVDKKDGKFVTVVKDEFGKPSALTLDELKQEFINSPKFAPFVIGSKATGSGATGATTSGQAAAVTNKKLSEMTTAEKLEYFKSKRQG